MDFPLELESLLLIGLTVSVIIGGATIWVNPASFLPQYSEGKEINNISPTATNPEMPNQHSLEPQPTVVTSSETPNSASTEPSANPTVSVFASITIQPTIPVNTTNSTNNTNQTTANVTITPSPTPTLPPVDFTHDLPISLSLPKISKKLVCSK